MFLIVNKNSKIVHAIGEIENFNFDLNIYENIIDEVIDKEIIKQIDFTNFKYKWDNSQQKFKISEVK